jgi:L-ascorbate metabolism protein UlaG (beta-lactamase superfamily)
MRVTKLGHSCVRIEHDGELLVVDPGGFTESGATEGATAVLVTHEHPDHLDVAQLAATDAPIYTIEAVHRRIAEADPALADRVQVVVPGQVFDAGLPVTAVGELHAVIHPDLPRFHNTGYVIDVGSTRIYHPGDALTPAGAPVDVLLLPMHAPWSKVSEVADFSRSVGARRSVAIHDAMLSDDGLGVVGRVLHGLLDTDEHTFERVRPGTDLAL